MLNCTYLVIGAGQTGLTAAYELAQMGKKVVLVEQAELGGTYLLSQEIPRYLLGKIAKDFSSSLKLFRKNPETFSVLSNYRQHISNNIFKKIEGYKSNLMAKIESNENLTIISGVGEFTSKSLAEINSQTERHLINFENAVIAVGKNTLLTPDIDGIESVDFLHQHNIFHFEKVPKSLGIIGLSAKSLKVADLYSNLGVKVDIFEEHDSATSLKSLDRSAFNYIIKNLLTKQVDFHFKQKILKISKDEGNIIVQTKDDERHTQSHIYIEADESFSDDQLGLNKLGLNWTPSGVVTNPNGQSQQRHVWALGECNNQVNELNKFSQIYDFLDRVKIGSLDSYRAPINNSIKSLTLTGNHIESVKVLITKVDSDSPVSTIGLTETEATAKFGRDVEIEIVDSGTLEGFLKLVIKSGSKQIVGVTLTGDFCNILEHFTIRSFQKSVFYIDYRNYIRSVLGL